VTVTIENLSRKTRES